MSRIDHHRPGYEYARGLGQFKKSYHLEMVADQSRTSAIFRALDEVLRPGTLFCELGCGTGLFSIFAAKRAKKVYAVEVDPDLAKVAAGNIRRSGFGERIELIEGDAREVELPERVDVIFCEMMSIWAIEEPQVPVFNSTFGRMLKPGGVFLPQRIVNLVEVGSYNFSFHGIEIRAATPIFAGIARAAVMTESRVARTLDFSALVDSDLSCEVELRVLGSGRANCARLTSIVQMSPDVVFSGSDSLMPPTIVPLEEDVVISAGERLLFQASARARSDLGEASFRATVISY
jgi:protein arginine N-methyltransferase 1